MKTKKFLGAVGVCAVMGCCSSQAAIYTQDTFNPGQNSSSPYYADFTSDNLTVSYSYNSTTGIGTLTASSSTGNNQTYTSGTSSPGTHGGDDTTFNGHYTLTAYLQDVGGQWDVVSGAFGTSTLDVYGALLGGTTTSSTLLLSANLSTGANTLNVNSANDFEFLFSPSGPTGSNTQIYQDFFGASGTGAVLLHPSTYINGLSYTNLTTGFRNTGLGTADSFVPEPSIYAGAGSFLALIGFISTIRKDRRNA